MNINMQSQPKLKSIQNSEFYLLLLVAVIMIFLALAAPGFYSLNNMMTTLNYFSCILVASIGMNMIILTGNMDVSAGAIISAISVTMGLLSIEGMPIGVFMPAGMLLGMGLSVVNALLIIKLRIPSIVATLSTTQLFGGVLPLIIEGAIYSLPPNFTWLAVKAKLFGFMPASILIMAIITIAALTFMRYSRFSKKVYAIGNNAHAARLSGINVNRTLIICFMIAGALYGVAATILATGGDRVTTTLGGGLEMTLISAVVLGGTSVSGGRGKVLGTVLGAFILSLILPALNYLKLPNDWSDAIKGAIILVTVIVSQLSLSTKKKRLRALSVEESK